MGRRTGSRTRSTELRIAAVRLVKAGVAQRSVAEAFDLHPSTVSRWCSLATKGGLNALARRPVTGRPRKLSNEALLELPRLLKAPPSEHGLPGRQWKLTTARDLIHKEYGVTYHPSHVSRLLRSLRIRLD
ncbi:MAG: helix-turn-helix domain-containing protein [Thermoplasmata archaeon]